MKTKNILGCISLLYCSSSTIAMQPMDDQSLSATTGQDGLILGIGIQQVQVDQISLIDTDGIAASSDYNNKAGLVLAQSGSPVTLSFSGANASSSTLNIVADADAGDGQAFANIAVSFADHITGLKVSPFSVYLAGSSALSDSGTSRSIFQTDSSLNTGVTQILSIGSNATDGKIDINFVSGNAPGMNIQLGNVPQGNMIRLNGAIQSVCSDGCPVMLVAEDTGAGFTLSLKATDSTNGFALDNFYAGIEDSGLVFGNTGTSDQLDISLGSLTLGTTGQATTGVFNGIQNGAIGNIGMVGASVTDLKVKISGM